MAGHTLKHKEMDHTLWQTYEIIEGTKIRTRKRNILYYTDEEKAVNIAKNFEKKHNTTV